MLPPKPEAIAPLSNTVEPLLIKPMRKLLFEFLYCNEVKV
jgi:hypothetical protein